jgi:hypothetical protein
VRARFGNGASSLELARVMYRFDYPFGPEQVVEFFRENYGPTTRAFAQLGEGERATLRSDLTELWRSHNQSKAPDRTIVDAQYLQVFATRA